MALPHILSEPPVIFQDPARCWSAAFESWHRAVSDGMNLPVSLSDDDLHRWFDGDRNLTTRRGSATDSGVRLMAGVGWMTLRRRRGPTVTRAFIDQLLNESHVYCAYYWAGNRRGHACVIYGVTDDGFLMMDPGGNRGLWRVDRTFFASYGRCLFGTSLLTGLSRSLDAALAPLLSPPDV